MNVVWIQWLLIVVAEIIHLIDANRITGNLCWSMPCMNGGSCFGSAYTYLCVCPVNYSGALCEKRLGICQESPCGNRGLCVETGSFSFECRCYFDYMGPLCEEHILKDDASAWSSLIPVHTRVLFDILQEAYRVKTNPRSDLRSTPVQADFPNLTTTRSNPTSSSPEITTKKVKSDPITHPSETTEIEHVTKADGIQQENIFPHTSTSSNSDISIESFTTEENDDNETTIFPNAIQTTENMFTTLLPTTIVENSVTVSVEQNQTDYSNITEEESFETTEQYDSTITSASSERSSDNSDNETYDDTTELIQNSTERISNNTELTDFYENTISPTINETSFESLANSSNQTDPNPLNTSEATMTSVLTSINPILSANQSIDPLDVSNSLQHQLLLKLCQQLLSHLLPNATSSSTSAAIEAALSLSSSSISLGNNSVEALLIRIKEQLSSTTTVPTKTTTTTTTTTKRPLSSSLPALLINEKKIPSISLQRVDMDDTLHQMNVDIDGENEFQS